MEQLTENLPDLLPEDSPQISDYNIYKYTDNLTTQGIIDNVKRIKLAFPDLPLGFYDILTLRLKEKNFTDMQFEDSINYVIDNCEYPKPTIAQFLKYVRKTKKHILIKFD